jgi:hypothetical protein
LTIVRTSIQNYATGEIEKIEAFAKRKSGIEVAGGID